MTLEVGNGIRLTELRRSDRDALIEHLSNKEIYKRTLRITAADSTIPGRSFQLASSCH
jgi:hypothetical protein